MGGFLSVGCWLYLDYTTRRRRSTAIDELIQDEWEGFQRWMDYTNVDFEVRGKHSSSAWFCDDR